MYTYKRCVMLRRLQLQECTFKIIMARYMFALAILDIIIDISGLIDNMQNRSQMYILQFNTL